MNTNEPLSDAEPVEEDETPRKSGPFGLVPTRAALDPKLSKGALRLLVLLCSYAGKLRFTWVGQRTLATRMFPKNPQGRRNVQRLLAELEDRGYIKISSKRGKTNGYRIIHESGLDAYVASTLDADTASTNTVEVDAKVSTEWTPKSNEVDATLAARTEVEQKKQQSESRALLSAAQRSPEDKVPNALDDPAAEEETGVALASIYPPGVTNHREMIEYIRNQKAAAKKDAEAEGLVAETLDAEAVKEEVR